MLKLKESKVRDIPIYFIFALVIMALVNIAMYITIEEVLSGYYIVSVAVVSALIAFLIGKSPLVKKEIAIQNVE